MPEEYNGGLITPVFKKGTSFDTGNYRPIAMTEPIPHLYAGNLMRACWSTQKPRDFEQKPRQNLDMITLRCISILRCSTVLTRPGVPSSLSLRAF